MPPSSPLTHMQSEAAFTLFQARAMLWVHIKGKDLSGAAWWEERLRNIACALIAQGMR